MAAQDPTAPTDTNGGALVVTAIVMLIVSWLSVCLRSYVRAILTNGFQADDWLMLVAQANFSVSCAFIVTGVYYGLGHHNRALDQQDEILALKYQALATATYVLNMWLIKLSIGIFLLRIAIHKRYKYTLYVSIGVVGIWSIVLFFWNIFQCSPVDAQWDYTILERDPTAHCASADEIVNAAYALSVMTILSDWLYALLPIPMIWQVKMTSQAKLTVVLILGMGIFASIATLIRLKFLADLTDIADILHAGTDAMVWTLIEPGVAISAASLVTVRPLLRRCKIKGFISTENSRRTGPSSRKSGSRTNRSNRMPGSGSQDVTLVDVELGHTKGRAESEVGTTTNKSARSKVAHLSKVSELSDDEYPSKTPDWGTEIRSAIHIVEDAASPQPIPDAHTRGTWLEQESHNGSSYELTRAATPTDYTANTIGPATPYKPTYPR
ncbi:hypothetical protein F5Y15DRAFT_155406 [Xylariaceae sp. FL0016]|nr:hypothetical protein F5Y15DRAFT_155406 [Xylariaceae sp. FL0016]